MSLRSSCVINWNQLFVSVALLSSSKFFCAKNWLEYTKTNRREYLLFDVLTSCYVRVLTTATFQPTYHLSPFSASLSPLPPFFFSLLFSCLQFNLRVSLISWTRAVKLRCVVARSYLGDEADRGHGGKQRAHHQDDSARAAHLLHFPHRPLHQWVCLRSSAYSYRRLRWLNKPDLLTLSNDTGGNNGQPNNFTYLNLKCITETGLLKASLCHCSDSLMRGCWLHNIPSISAERPHYIP